MRAASGTRTRCSMLKGLAADPPTGWSTLDSDAHGLIENRGRREAEDLVQLLSGRGGGVSKQAEQPAVAAQAYRDWLAEKTSRFRVPGTGVSLEIGEAWSELEVWQDSEGSSVTGRGGTSFGGRTLEELIASYREWSRLGLARAAFSPRCDVRFG